MEFFSNIIIGAIAGDLIGSVYEFKNVENYNFDFFNPNAFFTDDTVLTIAVADALVHNKDFAQTIWEYGNNYPNRGYGGRFAKWLRSDNPQPYNSFGNGSAMRVSPVGVAFDTLEKTLEVAKLSAEVTHNHYEGIKGAQSVAAAIFLARYGYSKNEIKEFVSNTFNYDLNFKIEQIRPEYNFDETCQGSVPQAIVAFLESSDFESAIRKAIYLGGDSDTIACITGGIALAFYKYVPNNILHFVYERLPKEFLDVLEEFDNFIHQNKLKAN